MGEPTDSTMDERLVALRASRAASTGNRLAPPSEFRGAPTFGAWRNPTIWLFGVAIALWAYAWLGYLDGSISAWWAVAVNSVAVYLGFTVFHESVHRSAHRNRRVNDALGWLPSLMLGFTYPVFRICHLKHHAHTNDEANDPDLFVAKDPGALRVLWLIGTLFNYRRLYTRNGWGSTAEKRTQQALDLALVASLPIGAATGHLDTILVLYWLPLLFAGLLLTYAFDYLPHHPHDSTERFHDTRIQPGRIRHGILLGQNYHLIHHLWVSVPWFRYRQVYTALEADLRAENIRIG